MLFALTLISKCFIEASNFVGLSAVVRSQYSVQPVLQNSPFSAKTTITVLEQMIDVMNCLKLCAVLLRELLFQKDRLVGAEKRKSSLAISSKPAESLVVVRKNVRAACSPSRAPAKRKLPRDEESAVNSFEAVSKYMTNQMLRLGSLSAAWARQREVSQKTRMSTISEVGSATG